MCLTKNEEPGRVASERGTALFTDESILCDEGRLTGMRSPIARSFVGPPSISVRGHVAVGCKNRLFHMGHFLV